LVVIRINVIYIFKNIQQVADFIVENTITENKLISKFLKGLSKKEIKDLIKISTLQYSSYDDAILNIY